MAESSQTGEIEEEPTTPKFPHFDVVTNHSDHHYAITKTKHSAPTTNFLNGSTQFHKRIMKEWKILEKDLPDTIYVRVYENRIDLMRAVIIGSAGTPYHDGLFFFDIAFPADYPNKPPLVYYHSFGLRINPNLYESGYVCLSLLNTWVGRKTEKWNPNESTILQVLVSIQGLVLNEKPYFNEPGIGIIPGKVKKSLVYSENVFIYSCKTMLYLLRRPPKNFEVFISKHFNERGVHILTACDDYFHGRCIVGFVGVENEPGSIKVSKRFKAALMVLFEELVVAFTKNGTSLGCLVEQLKEKSKMESSTKIKVDKTTSFKGNGMVKGTTKIKAEKTTLFKGNGMVKGKRFGTRWIMEKIKKFLGLKNDGGGKKKSVIDGEVNKKVKD